jgi:NAD-dependent SIR2 family protein deacetylase
MAELSDAERRDLISDYVDRATINWAHLAIAQLMKDGFVDRVFTTNFDPLVLRACALLGVFPAVYDFAASQRFKPAYLPEKAVFHLHGQHTGFVLLHTQ